MKKTTKAVAWVLVLVVAVLVGLLLPRGAGEVAATCVALLAAPILLS